MYKQMESKQKEIQSALIVACHYIADQVFERLKNNAGPVKTELPSVHDEKDIKFSITELAEYLGCSKATIHNYKKRAVFPYYQTGRTVYFKKNEIDKSLESSRMKGSKSV
jgi:excisionase family DNA binding protein